MRSNQHYKLVDHKRSYETQRWRHKLASWALGSTNSIPTRNDLFLKHGNNSTQQTINESFFYAFDEYFIILGCLSQHSFFSKFYSIKVIVSGDAEKFKTKLYWKTSYSNNKSLFHSLGSSVKEMKKINVPQVATVELKLMAVIWNGWNKTKFWLRASHVGRKSTFVWLESLSVMEMSWRQMK